MELHPPTSGKRCRENSNRGPIPPSPYLQLPSMHDDFRRVCMMDSIGRSRNGGAVNHAIVDKLIPGSAQAPIHGAATNRMMIPKTESVRARIHPDYPIIELDGVHQHAVKNPDTSGGQSVMDGSQASTGSRKPAHVHPRPGQSRGAGFIAVIPPRNGEIRTTSQTRLVHQTASSDHGGYARSSSCAKDWIGTEARSLAGRICRVHWGFPVKI